MNKNHLASFLLALALTGCNTSPSATPPVASTPNAPPAPVAGPTTPVVAAAPDVEFDKAKAQKGYQEVKKLGHNPLPANADTWKKGQVLFLQNCSPCHGATGRGDGPAGAALDPKPRDFTNITAYKYGYGDLGIFRTAKYGTQDTGMAPWEGRMKDEEIWQVVYFVRTLQKP